MRVLVLGTSNSVLRTGWVAGLRASMPNSEIVSCVLGASPGTMFGLHLDEIENFDLIFFDSVPNDEQLNQHRPYLFTLRRRVLYEIISTLSSRARLVVLGFTNKINLGQETPTYSDRRHLSSICDAQFIDVRSIVIDLGAEIIGSELPLYEHPAHPHRDIARAIGYEIGRAFNDFVWPERTKTTEDFAENFSQINVTKLVPSENTIRLQNSLISIECAKLLPGSVVNFNGNGKCIGFLAQDFLGAAVEFSDGEKSFSIAFPLGEQNGSFEVKFFELDKWYNISSLNILREFNGIPLNNFAVFSKLLFWQGDAELPIPEESVTKPMLLHGQVVANLRHRLCDWSKSVAAHREGQALSKTDGKELAYAKLNAALLFDPHHAEALYRLSHVCIALGRTQESESLFRRLRETYPTDISYMHEHGRILIRLGKKEEAHDLLVQVSQVAPERPGLQNDLRIASERLVWTAPTTQG